MKVAADGFLPAQPERAWEALADWERQAEWMPDADSVTVVGERREGVGTRIAVRTRLFGIPAFTEVLEVTNWHPGIGLEIRHGGPVRGYGRWRLRPVAGGSRFLWEEDFRLAFGGPFGELAAAVYAPFMRWLMRRAIRGLAGRLAGDG